ncbi:MAG: hypothetical protein Q8Q65_03105 [bacterium]|nr:hypothetical protein [bacterium]
MKLLIDYFESSSRIWGVVVFSLSVVVGLFTGYYPVYRQQSLVGELIETDKEYREESMSQLSYQIRHFSVTTNDQVPQSN